MGAMWNGVRRYLVDRFDVNYGATCMRNISAGCDVERCNFRHGGMRPKCKMCDVEYGVVSVECCIM